MAAKITLDIENKNKTKESAMKELLRPVAFFLALIGAALFTYVFPGSGIEQVLVPAVGSLLGYMGLKTWRDDYGQFKLWFKSKTVIGALLVVVPVFVLAASILFGFMLPDFVTSIITGLITVGGGTSITGILHAYIKNKN